MSANNPRPGPPRRSPVPPQPIGRRAPPPLPAPPRRAPCPAPGRRSPNHWPAGPARVAAHSRVTFALVRAGPCPAATAAQWQARRGGAGRAAANGRAGGRARCGGRGGWCRCRVRGATGRRGGRRRRWRWRGLAGAWRGWPRPWAPRSRHCASSSPSSWVRQGGGRRSSRPGRGSAPAGGTGDPVAAAAVPRYAGAGTGHRFARAEPHLCQRRRARPRVRAEPASEIPRAAAPPVPPGQPAKCPAAAAPASAPPARGAGNPARFPRGRSGCGPGRPPVDAGQGGACERPRFGSVSRAQELYLGLSRECPVMRVHPVPRERVSGEASARECPQPLRCCPVRVQGRRCPGTSPVCAAVVAPCGRGVSSGHYRAGEQNLPAPCR